MEWFSVRGSASATKILDPRTPVRRNRRTGVRGSRISGARKSGGSGTFSKRPFPPPRPPLGNCSTPDCRAPRGTHNESFAKVSRNFAKRFLAPFKGIHTESFAKLSRKFREDRASGGTGDICARARGRSGAPLPGAASVKSTFPKFHHNVRCRIISIKPTLTNVQFRALVSAQSRSDSEDRRALRIRC